MNRQLQNKRMQGLFGGIWKAAVLLLLSVGLCFQAGAQDFEWAIHMGDSSGKESTAGRVIAQDAIGNTYIAGYFKGTVDFDPGQGISYLSPLGGRTGIFLAKYDTDGKYLWAKNIIGNQIISNVTITVDLQNNVIVGGEFGDTTYFHTNYGLDTLVPGANLGNDIYLAKYSSNGSYMWLKHMARNAIDTPWGMVTGNATAPKVAVDKAGNIYVTGIFFGTYDFDPDSTVADLISVSTSTNPSNTFIAKYTPSGDYIWAKGIGGVGYVQSADIIVDTFSDKEDIYVTGFFVDTIDFDPGVGVANLNSNVNSARGDNAFLAKYDSSGGYIWSKGMLGSGNIARSGGSTLAIDTFGNVYVAGYLVGTVDFDPGPDTALLAGVGIGDAFFAKYDAEGTYIWAKGIGGIGSYMDPPASIAIDKKVGNIYLAGRFIGSVDFDPSSDTAILIAAAGAFSYNGFLAKYDACGHYIWAGNIEGLASGCYDMVLNQEEDVLLTGYFMGSAEFDFWSNTAALTAIGLNDAFLSKVHFDDTALSPTYLTVTTCEESYTLNGTVYTQSGTYVQVIPGFTHCDSTLILDLTLDSITTPYVTTNGFTLGVNHTYKTYQWLKNDVPIPGATQSEYTVTANATYRVAVSNEAGCLDTSDAYTVNNYTGDGINDPGILAGQVHVYPNPTMDKVYFQSPVPVNITLTDLSGRTIIQKEDARVISLQSLSAGVYLIRITSSKGIPVSTVKITKR